MTTERTWPTWVAWSTAAALTAGSCVSILLGANVLLCLLGLGGAHLLGRAGAATLAASPWKRVPSAITLAIFVGLAIIVVKFVVLAGASN